MKTNVMFNHQSARLLAIAKLNSEGDKYIRYAYLQILQQKEQRQ